VTGIVKSHSDGAGNLQRALVTDAHKLLQAPLGILDGIQWLHRQQILLLTLFVDKLDVRFLNVPRIPQHDAAQIAGGVGAEDMPAKAVFDQIGNVAAVIYVSMGKNEDVDTGWIKGKRAVALEGFLSLALKETAVEQDVLPVEG